MNWNQDIEQDTEQARSLFPAGLVQPEGSYRFSVDALVLADAAVELAQAGVCRKGQWFELGTGCGVVSLGVLLKTQGIRICGLEQDSELTEAANENARRLGVPLQAEQAVFGSADWKKTAEALRQRYGRSACVLTNPPWRRMDSGRLPATLCRRRALFRDEHTLEHFVDAAAGLLLDTGVLIGIVGTGCLPDWLAAQQARGFCLRRMRFIHAQACRPALFAITAARRSGGGALLVEAPLLTLDGYAGQQRQEDGEKTFSSIARDCKIV